MEPLSQKNGLKTINKARIIGVFGEESVKFKFGKTWFPAYMQFMSIESIGRGNYYQNNMTEGVIGLAPRALTDSYNLMYNLK